ncbi:MAG TPA: hypothetical protein DCM64_08715 [Gammaproteobacteria bacterium]|jgi:hypothetical protein|nr:hypothetical protein [Gammaproteobacteria bacterium]HAJ76525.1 hypothetical protein [Gammaproteobacteria bacterium]|tara:strand:+ start:614 stop:853 length:240 start_codon:yes stop_codon:yes gene_type:complete
MGFVLHFGNQKLPSMKFSIPIDLDVRTGLFIGPARPVKENQGAFPIAIDSFYSSCEKSSCAVLISQAVISKRLQNFLQA